MPCLDSGSRGEKAFAKTLPTRKMGFFQRSFGARIAHLASVPNGRRPRLFGFPLWKTLVLHREFLTLWCVQRLVVNPFPVSEVHMAPKKKAKKAAKRRPAKKKVAKRRPAKKKAAKRRPAKKKVAKRRPAKKKVAKKKKPAKKKVAKKKKPAKKKVAKKKKPAKKKVAKKKPAKKKVAKKPKKKAAKKKVKRKPNPAFMKPMTPDAALAGVVGSAPLPRTQITKKLWAYIKRNGLQDQQNRRMINADDKLRSVFNGKTQVSMFEMTKLVNRHIT